MKERALILAAVCALLGFCASAAIMPNDWPVAYQDVLHSSQNYGTSSIPLEELGVLCSYDADGELSAPVAADINSDGKSEVLFGSSEKKLYAISPDCRQLWVFQAGGAVGTPGIYDLSSDGNLEILFGSSDGKIYAIDAAGKELWTYQTGGPVMSSPVAANFDYSPELEVVAPSTDKNIYVLDHEGNLLRSIPVLSSVESTPAIGDINWDGKKEIVVGSPDKGLMILEYPGLRRWDLQIGGASDAAITDANRDGLTEIVVGGTDKHVYYVIYAEYEKGTERVCRNGNCSIQPIIYSTLVKLWNYTTGGEVVSCPVAADVDGNLKKEIIAGSVDKTLYILNDTGKGRAKSSANSRIQAAPAVADIDGDLMSEIIYGSADGMLHILNASGFQRWSYKTGDMIDRQPAVADLEQSGNLNIIVSSGKKLLIFGRKQKLTERPVPTTVYYLPPTTTVQAVTTTSSTAAKVAATIPSNSTSMKESVDVTPLSLLSFLSTYLLISLGLFIAVMILYDILILSHRRNKGYGLDLKDIEESQALRSMKHF